MASALRNDEQPRGRAGRRRRALVAAGLLSLGPLELALHVAFAARAPDERAWAAARPWVEATRRPGDLVVASPRWAEPHARLAFGEASMPLGDVARPDESRYARALEVAAYGARDDAFAGWRLLEERAEGRLTLRLWENPAPAGASFDLVDAIGRGLAEVAWAGPGGEANPCPFVEVPAIAPGTFGHPALGPKRYVCGPEPWYAVAVTVIDDERHRPRRCVYAPPPPPPWREVVVRVRGLPAANVLEGHWGLPYVNEREGTGAPIDLEVRAGGATVGALTHRDGEGWAPFALPLAGEARAGAELSFHVSGAGAEGRSICWRAGLR